MKDHESTIVIMDGVLVYAQNEEGHNYHLNAVLQTIKDSGLKLYKDKCHFRKSEM